MGVPAKSACPNVLMTPMIAAVEAARFTFIVSTTKPTLLPRSPEPSMVPAI